MPTNNPRPISRLIRDTPVLDAGREARQHALTRRHAQPALSFAGRFHSSDLCGHLPNGTVIGKAPEEAKYFQATS